eukprot:3034744-Amphidinium_carterae.1
MKRILPSVWKSFDVLGVIHVASDAKRLSQPGEPTVVYAAWFASSIVAAWLPPMVPAPATAAA